MNIATSECVDGECAITCDGDDHDDCDRRSATGCETDLNTDAAALRRVQRCVPRGGHAGHRDERSAWTATAQISCDGVNHDDCDDVVSTGCETDLQTTAACTAASATQRAPRPARCSIATSECPAGGCVPVCDPDWADDDGMLATGCETPSPLFHYTVSNFDPR